MLSESESNPPNGPYGWAVAGAALYSSWADVCLTGAPTLLTLDPFAEPVTLPWEHLDRGGYQIGVCESQRPWAAARVGQYERCADLTPAAEAQR